MNINYILQAKFASGRVCECGYNIKAHSQDVHLKESESQPYTKVSPTNAFGKLDFCVRGKNTAGMPSRRVGLFDFINIL